jgi:tripartite-type tricarboxylate transporter receptor subunit TctC
LLKLTKASSNCARGRGRRLEAEQSVGMLARARTPATLIGRLNREIGDVVRAPFMRTALLTQGAEPTPGSPQEFSAFIKLETAKLGKVMI